MIDSRLLCHEHFDERRKHGTPTFFHVVHKLEESEIERKSLLRYASVRTKPGAMERSEARDGVDMDLTVTVSILVPCMLPGGVTDSV